MGLSVKTNINGGGSVSIGNKVWVNLGPVWFSLNKTICSDENDCLKVTKTWNDQGRDRLGKFSIVNKVYGTSSGKQFQTTLKTYTDIPAVVFGQVK